MRLIHAVVGALAISLGCGDSGTDSELSESCSGDWDCPSNQSCIEGRCATGDTGQYRVYGTVRSWDTGTPLSNVAISLGGHSDSTDSSGSYSVPSLSEREYEITFSQSGYLTRSLEISVFGADKQFDVFLLPREDYSSGNISVAAASVSAYGAYPFSDLDEPFLVNISFDFEDGNLCPRPIRDGSRNIMYLRMRFTAAGATLSTPPATTLDAEFCELPGTATLSTVKFVGDGARDHAILVEGSASFANNDCGCRVCQEGSCGDSTITASFTVYSVKGEPTNY